MVFIGVLFNTETMAIEVTPERLNELRLLLKEWLFKEQAPIKEIQSLLGKLNFVAACVKSGHIFISRMLKWLYSKDLQKYHIPPLCEKKTFFGGTNFYQHIMGYLCFMRSGVNQMKFFPLIVV